MVSRAFREVAAGWRVAVERVIAEGGVDAQTMPLLQGLRRELREHNAVSCPRCKRGVIQLGEGDCPRCGYVHVTHRQDRRLMAGDPYYEAEQDRLDRRFLGYGGDD